MKCFKQYFKEEIGDFGDQDDEMVDVEYGNEKEKMRWVEARGFIEPSGKINRIDKMPHEHYAMDLGHPTMVNGKLINKKYKNVKDLGVETGLIRWSPETHLIRWSPETHSLTVFKVMTAEQIKVLKTLLKAYGYHGITIEFLNKETNSLESVEFNDKGSSRFFDSKLMRIQSRIA